MSLVFELEQINKDEISSDKCGVNIEYSLPTETPAGDTFFPKTLNFLWPLPIQTPPVLYILEPSYPTYSYVGSFVQFEFAISKEEKRETPAELQYEILVDRKLWILSGHKRNSFTLTKGERRKFSFKLMALTSGYLPIPEIHLHNIDDSRILNSQRAKQIYIFPATNRIIELSPVPSIKEA